ncbi:hypothetical protein EV651_11213 [Kribbella sp. VKM Ac-2571]|nr:hypothetical protein EV651_11213 [Kribbella sp. VKM Ac-2571]
MNELGQLERVGSDVADLHPQALSRAREQPHRFQRRSVAIQWDCANDPDQQWTL